MIKLKSQITKQKFLRPYLRNFSNPANAVTLASQHFGTPLLRRTLYSLKLKIGFRLEDKISIVLGSCLQEESKFTKARESIPIKQLERKTFLWGTFM